MWIDIENNTPFLWGKYQQPERTKHTMIYGMDNSKKSTPRVEQLLSMVDEVVVSRDSSIQIGGPLS